MRVLFFSEPFPVRHRPLDFVWVIDRWAPLADGFRARGIDVCWACTDDVLKERPLEQAVTPTTLGLAARCDTSCLDKRAIDAAWVRLMTDSHEPTWSPIVEAILDQQKPDAVITWTNNAPLLRLCRERGVVVVHQEQGPLRAPLPALFFADPIGVNGASAVRSLWPDLVRQPWSRTEETQLELWQSTCYPFEPTRDRDRAEMNVDPKRRTIAVFGQVSRDSTVLTWSCVDGYRGLLDAVARVSVEKFDIVFKPHPAEPLRGELPFGVKLAPDGMSAKALIAASDVVVTINSSVALEGLLQARPVYLFGKGPFAGVGATRDIDDPVAFCTRLETDSATLTTSEDVARKRLLWFLLLRYFRGASSSTDPDQWLAMLRTWQSLQARNAPLLEYFPESSVTVRLLEDVAFMQTDRVESSRATLATELALATAWLTQAAARERALHMRVEVLESASRESTELAEALTRRLEALVNSFGLRAVRLVRRVPGLYRSYRWAKTTLVPK